MTNKLSNCYHFAVKAEVMWLEGGVIEAVHCSRLQEDSEVLFWNVYLIFVLFNVLNLPLSIIVM